MLESLEWNHEFPVVCVASRELAANLASCSEIVRTLYANVPTLFISLNFLSRD